MSDPYDLLRRARDFMKEDAQVFDSPIAKAWLRDYQKLPGAKLSKKAVYVLRDPQRRVRGINQDIVEQLLKDGFLQKVSTHAFKYTQWRINKKGREALRLRSDVK